MTPSRRGLLAGGLGLALSPALPRPARAFYSDDDLNAVVTADPGELDLTLRADGPLPEALLGGTYLLNGPGRVRVGGRLVHPFDGHGFVRAMRFEPDGTVRLRARFVRTDTFVEEEAAGRLTRRGVGSLLAERGEPDWAKTNRGASIDRNVANTTITPWGGALLCGWEGGPPTAIDPDSLATRGHETFGGALSGGPFLAHVKVDARAGRLVGLSLNMGVETRFTVHELDAAGREVARAEHVRDGASFQHDLALTERFVILSENPLRLRIGGMVRLFRGKGDMLGAVATKDAEGALLLIPRGGGATLRVPLGRPAWCLHHANAWEEGGRVILVACVFDEMGFGEEFGYQGLDAPLSREVLEAVRPQRLVRMVLDPEAGRLLEWRELDPRTVDFPRVRPDLDGRPARLAVAGARSEAGRPFPFDAALALDLLDPERPARAWVPGGRFVGEPLLVPADDDQGALCLVMSHDAAGRSCALHVLDPEDMRAPLASVALPLLMPYGFHGGWLPAA